MSGVINLDIFFRDHGAARGLQKLGTDAEIAARKHDMLRKAALGIGLLAGAAIIKFGRDSVREFTKAEEAQHRLEFAFSQFPKLADTNQAALQRLNLALEKKTKFDDQAIASGQAVLAQFNLTGRQLTEVTPLLLDYAAKTGQDLPDAAAKMGKAFLGNTRALKAIGISYKTTGDAGKDFANITALMRQKVGGFAEAEGKTFTGRLDILQNQFRNLQEAAGAHLVPALTGVVEELTKLVEFVGANKQVIGPLAFTVIGLSVAIWSVNKATKMWAITQAVVGGLSTKAVAGLSALKVAFTGVELSAVAAGRAMKIAQLSIPIIGIALFAVTSALEIFASKSTTAADSANGFAEAMKSVEGNVTRATAALNENVRAQAVNELQTKGAFTQAKLLGLSYQTVTDAALGNTDAINEVNRVNGEALRLDPRLSKANVDKSNAAIGLAKTMISVGTAEADATTAEQVRRAAMITSTTTSAELKAATDKVTTANKNLKIAIQDVINKFTILNGGALSAEQTDQAWQAAIDGVTASVKTNGRSLDIHKEKGRQNRNAIIAMITALNDEAVKTFKSTYEHSKARTEQGKLTEANKAAKRVVDAGKISIDKAATANHLNAREVHNLTGEMIKVPKKMTVPVTTPGLTGSKGARAQIQGLHTDIRDLRTKDISVRIAVSTQLDKLNQALVKRYGLGARKIGLATGGVLPGFTPGRDVHNFYSPTGGQLDLSGGEAIMRPEWTRAVGGPRAVARMNTEARSGRVAFADGGVIAAVGLRGSTYNYGKLRDYAASASAAAGASMARDLGLQAIRAAGAAAVAAAKAAAAAAAASGGGGGPIGKGGYASALSYARRHVGHPYIFGTLWDCSGFISALHSIILGQSPHRRYSTPAFHGAHAQGFTRGKRSPFMIGVNPSPGRFGHMAGTLNNVNVESAGGVGVRIGSRARGWNAGMFSWRGGLAKGGVIRRSPTVGDLPFDLLDPRGERYNPELAAMYGYGRGGVVTRPSLIRAGEHGPERVLSPVQTRSFDRLSRVLDHSGGAGAGGCTEIHFHFPNYVGSQNDLVRTLTNLNRAGRLEVIKQR